MNFKHIRKAFIDALLGGVVVGALGLGFIIDSTVTSSFLLLCAFYIISKNRNLITACVVCLIPIIVNTVDSFPGRQTEFRHFMFSVYSVCLILVAIKNKNTDKRRDLENE